MNADWLHDLSPAMLRELARALRDGPLATSLSERVLDQIVGPKADSVGSGIRTWYASGMTAATLALTVDALAESRERAPDPSELFDLVLSGPNLPGVPTFDTEAVFHSLIEQAERDVLFVGYAVHKGRSLFARLAERMAESPDLRVTFCMDISRPWGDTSLSEDIVHRYAHEFRSRHWPWTPVPDLYYDPRSLNDRHDVRSSLHAKCVVIDRREALITSANFTEAAQERNIEVGIRVRHRPIAERLRDYFATLADEGALRCCPLQK
jgi:phosphatidylserine/phosphatidylglycerophosphate/cardiolipin synthase-like enzyme